MNEIVSINKGSDVELNIESLAFGGMGVAHLNEMVTFVKNAIPGQKVNARITKKRSSYLEARTLEVLRESPHFMDVKCEHFADCGGCTFQNLDYKMLKVRFSTKSLKFLKTVEKKTSSRLVKKIKKLAEEPFPNDCKRLVNVKGKIFRVRVGKYRIQYEILGNDELFISKIDKRSRIYIR